jgi:hypothetical protein
MVARCGSSFGHRSSRCRPDFERHGISSGAGRFQQKAFTRDALAAKVREALDA